MSTVPFYQVSKTAQRALEEFSNEFASALVLGEINPWAAKYGLVRNTQALSTTFPLPLGAAGFEELKDDIKYRHLYARFMNMKTKLWSDGLEEFAHIIEQDPFFDWAGHPARIANAWARQPNIVVAAMLAQGAFAGPVLSLYDDPDEGTAGTRRLFATDHPADVIGISANVNDNIMTCTTAELLNGSAFEAIDTRFGNFKGPDGNLLGLSLKSCLVPHTRKWTFKKALEPDTLVNAITNVGAQQGTANVVAAVSDKNIYSYVSYDVADELQSQNYFYAFGSKPDIYPWVVQTGGAPTELRHDKTSAKYLETFKIAIGYVGQLNSAGAMPQNVIRVEITV